MIKAQLTQQADIVSVEGVLDFVTVISVWQQAKKIQWHENVCFDFSKVTKTSSAALALVMGLVRLSLQNQRAIVFKNLPEDLVRLAKVSGVQEMIPLVY